MFGGVCCFELFPFQEKIGTDCDVLEQSSVCPSSSPDGNMHVYSVSVCMALHTLSLSIPYAYRMYSINIYSRPCHDKHENQNACVLSDFLP